MSTVNSVVQSVVHGVISGDEGVTVPGINVSVTGIEATGVPGTVVATGLPALRALTYDPTNDYKMVMVRNGTGSGTSTHSTVLYAPDVNNIQQQFPIDDPVWEGGRVVLSGSAGSDVVSVHANIASGSSTLIDPLPVLRHYQAMENVAIYSNDLTQWDQTGTDVSARDEVGITGEANTATTLTDNNDSGYEFVQLVGLTALSGAHKVWVKKDLDETRFPFIDVSSYGGIFLNTKTGAILPRVGQEPTFWEVQDGGDWWIVLFSSSGVGGTLRVMPAGGNVWDGTLNTAATGSCIVSQAEKYEQLPIAKCRTLGPIFTAATAVTYGATDYELDAANSADTPSSWYMEVSSDGAQAILDGFLSVTGANWQLDDGTTTTTRPWVEGTTHSIGIAVGDSTMAISVDDTWSSTVAYDGTLLQGVLDLFRSGTFPASIRELQRSNV